VLILVITATVGLVEILISGHRGHLFGIAFVATTTTGALVVRRRDLPVAMIAPPLLYCLLILLASVVDNTVFAGDLRTREALYVANAFVTGAPAMWGGSIVAAAIGWYRLRARPRTVGSGPGGAAAAPAGNGVNQ
jgi:hypothetical protein